jgi:hypothetical protein
MSGAIYVTLRNCLSLTTPWRQIVYKGQRRRITDPAKIAYFRTQLDHVDIEEVAPPPPPPPPAPPKPEPTPEVKAKPEPKPVPAPQLKLDPKVTEPAKVKTPKPKAEKPKAAPVKRSPVAAKRDGTLKPRGKRSRKKKE